MPTILVADDDSNIRELVRIFLQREGFGVLEAADGVQALTALDGASADLAIVDVMMPHMNGWQLCSELRKRGDMPILMLTAKGETADKVKGFDLGADDYLVKPFEPAELTARVKALFKRFRIAASQTVRLGGLMIDRQTFELECGGAARTLPPKEFDLLFKLMSHPGRTLTREALITDIWGYDYEGNERTLDVHINRLREKLAEWEAKLRIATVRGLGYRLEELS